MTTAEEFYLKSLPKLADSDRRRFRAATKEIKRLQKAKAPDAVIARRYGDMSTAASVLNARQQAEARHIVFKHLQYNL